MAEIPAAKLVEAHGTFSTASCIRCHKSYDGEQIKVSQEREDTEVYRKKNKSSEFWLTPFLRPMAQNGPNYVII